MWWASWMLAECARKKLRCRHKSNSLYHMILLQTTEEKSQTRALQLCCCSSYNLTATHTAQEGGPPSQHSTPQHTGWAFSYFPVQGLTLVSLKPAWPNTNNCAFSLWKPAIATSLSSSSFALSNWISFLFLIFCSVLKFLGNQFIYRQNVPYLTPIFYLEEQYINSYMGRQQAPEDELALIVAMSYWDQRYFVLRNTNFHTPWNLLRAQYLPGSVQNSGQGSHYLRGIKGVSNKHHKAQLPAALIPLWFPGSPPACLQTTGRRIIPSTEQRTPSNNCCVRSLRDTQNRASQLLLQASPKPYLQQ